MNTDGFFEEYTCSHAATPGFGTGYLLEDDHKSVQALDPLPLHMKAGGIGILEIGCGLVHLGLQQQKLLLSQIGVYHGPSAFCEIRDNDIMRRTISHRSRMPKVIYHANP